jgi:hypothetical protein
MVERLKWTLLIFKNIYGLKINLSKSELVPLNLDPAQGQYLASLLNCSLGKLPIKYLGVNLYWKKPSKSDWQLLIDKIHKKLPQWKGKHLSLGGRLVLLNSVLSSIPLYYISLFKIAAWVLFRIDQIRKRFLWAGVNSSTTRKYYLVRWATICRAKEFGGWGVINLAQMNCALLCKWGWKFLYKDSQGYWKDLISIKYKNFSTSACSPFWRDVCSVLYFVVIDSTRLVGNGESINFWHDNWFNNCSLALQFPLVFSKAKSDRVNLSQVWNFSNTKLFLTKGVGSAMRVEKTRLLFILSNLHLSSDFDSIFWHLDKSGLFNVHSMYKFLNSGGAHTPVIRSVWSL